MRSLKSILLGSAVGLAAFAASAAQATEYDHVLLISVDGMHAIDLSKFVETHPDSVLRHLSYHGTIFPNAYTTAPSDSFPGMVAQVTGASPKTADVFYDDSYDRILFAAGSKCEGKPGVETNLSEALDRNPDLLNAGGTIGEPLTQIDPAKLPLHLVDGKCLPVYPHQVLHANTVFEVIKEAGRRTAWSDKHPAYEILNGPSGMGIDDLYTPEINSLIPGQTKDNTTSFAAVAAYDAIKVKAVLNEIDGRNSTGTERVGVPAIMGMNFQAVSVGQKLAKGGYGDKPGLVGGYLDAVGTPGNALEQELLFVDRSIGRMVHELRGNHLRDSTLIIVSAKHGQSPIDLSTRVAVDDAPYTKMPGYGFHIADDVGLVWMDPNTRTPKLVQQARNYLEANKATLHLQAVLGEESLKEVYQSPAYDLHTPDFITIVEHGVIYTGGTKLAEHGGFDQDDRNVALLVSSPRIEPSIDYTIVETKQIAPTILSALGLDPNKLLGVRREGTQKLPN